MNLFDGFELEVEVPLSDNVIEVGATIGWPGPAGLDGELSPEAIAEIIADAEAAISAGLDPNVSLVQLFDNALA